MSSKPFPARLRLTLAKLSLQEKQAVYEWLGTQIDVERSQLEDGSTADSEGSASAIVESRTQDGKTYQLEKRRCGKGSCKCAIGDLQETGHGPYWYAYWKESGKLKSRYIGRQSPWSDPLK
ncbi:MAG: hypothetical protein KME43_18360 [Myxacorys chilensis ATA2-1-KO14]|jgi:hypothetical protein|nr:hypothetical protein [Myxacorys chilensis ATA2-1-KO14]